MVPEQQARQWLGTCWAGRISGPTWGIQTCTAPLPMIAVHWEHGKTMWLWQNPAGFGLSISLLRQWMGASGLTWLGRRSSSERLDSPPLLLPLYLFAWQRVWPDNFLLFVGLPLQRIPITTAATVDISHSSPKPHQEFAVWFSQRNPSIEKGSTN